MTTRERLESVAWASAVVCFCAVVFGYWHLALVAAISAAVATMWLGCIDYCNRRPTEPEGVRIVHPDGSVTPCELLDKGLDGRGYREWQITTRMGVGDWTDWDYMPAMTKLSTYVNDDVAGARWDGNRYRMEGHA